MSVLVELGEQISNTQSLIARHEAAAAGCGAELPRSLLINIRSLEKLKRKLEAEYLAVAASKELEVYSYRLLNESDRVTLPGVAEAWTKFQEFFGAVYTALTESTNAKDRKPSQSQSLELGYGYSFASSVGVVVTFPREIGIYAAVPIEEASGKVFDLIEAKNVSAIAKELGPAPIKALHEWIGVHVKYQYGIGLEWQSEGKLKRSTTVQYQSLARLQDTIGETTTRATIDLEGKLFSVNDKLKEFELEGDNGKEYRGKFENAITMEHAASVPARCKARIIEITKIVLVGKEAETVYFLENLSLL